MDEFDDNRDKYDKLVDALFEGTAGTDETARLLGNTDGEELEELTELVETLARIDPDLAAPGEAEFRAARESVLARISTRQSPSRTTSLGRWLPLAAALAAFAVGLAVGKGNAAPPPTELTLTDLVARNALSAQPETDFRYSNLELEEVDENTLAVRVNVAADLELTRPKNDLLVTDILASSLLNEDSLGARLKAVRHAPSSPRIQRALTTAALGDPDMSVRLKALERLVEQLPASAETQATLLHVLENEESVVMRLVAIDALADDRLEPALLDSVGQNPTEDGADTVLWHAQQRLNRRRI